MGTFRIQAVRVSEHHTGRDIVFKMESFLIISCLQ